MELKRKAKKCRMKSGDIYLFQSQDKKQQFLKGKIHNKRFEDLLKTTKSKKKSKIS